MSSFRSANLSGSYGTGGSSFGGSSGNGSGTPRTRPWKLSASRSSPSFGGNRNSAIAIGGGSPITDASSIVRSLQIKLVLLGDSAVGKSSLVLRFVRGEFQESKEPTIGAAFVTQRCRIPEDPSRVVKFEIWDTAGQERFNSLAPMYYRNAQAAVVVYDVTDERSFERAQQWIMELKRQADANIIIALAANKSDLLSGSSGSGESLSRPRRGDTPVPSHESQTSQTPAVPREEVVRFAADHHLLLYETSAKSGNNVNEMFTDIARHLSAQWVASGGDANSPMSARSGARRSLVNVRSIAEPDRTEKDGRRGCAC